MVLFNTGVIILRTSMGMLFTVAPKPSALVVHTHIKGSNYMPAFHMYLMYWSEYIYFNFKFVVLAYSKIKNGKNKAVYCITSVIHVT